MVSLTASWEMAPRDGARWAESMQVTGAGDVEALLERLGTPPADDAYLEDLRPGVESPLVKVAVRGDWVYLRWLDDDVDGAPAGDARSPVAHGGYEPEYFAGTGLSRAVAADVLKQWLATGRRPDVVTWIDLDDLLPPDADD
jgi:Immunity protein Imm1